MTEYQNDFFGKLSDEPEPIILPDDGPEPVEPISPEFEVIEPPRRITIIKKGGKETLKQKMAREKEERIRRFQEREQERKDIHG